MGERAGRRRKRARSSEQNQLKRVKRLRDKRREELKNGKEIEIL